MSIMVVTTDSREAVICGMHVLRPPSITTTDWEAFWSGKHCPWEIGDFVIDAFDEEVAVILGITYEKPQMVLIAEWTSFFASRQRIGRGAFRSGNKIGPEAVDEAYQRRTGRKKRS